MENEQESPLVKAAVDLTADILKTVCQPDVVTVVLPRGITFNEAIVPMLDARDFLEMIAPVVIVET
jgi:hypothetical protein